MSKSKNHIDQLTPELIEKYQKGLLSEDEQYQVERLMLNSPFDTEAMEGFESFEGTISSDLSQLNKKLKQRIAEEKNDTSFFWIKIAASVLILALSTYLIWDLSTDENIKPLAQNETEVSSIKESRIAEESSPELSKDVLNDTSLLALSPAKRTDSDKKKDQVSIEKTESDQSRLALSLQPIAEVNNNTKLEIKELATVKPVEEENIEQDSFIENLEVSDVQEETVAEEYFIAEKKSSESAEDVIEGRAASTVMSKKSKSESKTESAPTAAKDVESFNYSTSISGKVTSSENNQPLPGVNVTIKGTTIGTVTDQDGNYNIEASDLLSTNSIVFSSIGLVTEEVKIGKREVLNIKLSEDIQQLSEVVVTRSSDSNDLNGIYKFAQPEIGIVEFKKYLKENIHYPEDTESKPGRVVVTFDVDTNGTLSNFEIKRSLGEWQDDEAIRLVKEGPGWNPSMNGNTPELSNVRVVVKFEGK